MVRSTTNTKDLALQDLPISRGRSRIMRGIRSRDTKPEKEVRPLLHALGYRFRLHRHDLPGTPDIVFPSRRKVIFVNGGFWHAHDCKNFKFPRTRAEYWRKKLKRNQQRDKQALAELAKLGWQSLTIWECEVRGCQNIAKSVTHFLDCPNQKLPTPG